MEGSMSDGEKVALGDFKAVQGRLNEIVALWEGAGVRLLKSGRDSEKKDGCFFRGVVSETASLEINLQFDTEAKRATIFDCSFCLNGACVLFVCHFTDGEVAGAVEETWTLSLCGIEPEENEKLLESCLNAGPSFVTFVRSRRERLRGWRETKSIIAEMAPIFLAVTANGSAPKSST